MKHTKILLSLLITASVASTAHADVLGAVAGGLIGSQFGQGNGRIAMAAVGAVVGDRVTTPSPVYMQQQGYYQPRPVRYYSSTPVYIDGRDGAVCPPNLGSVYCQQWMMQRPVVIMQQN